MNSPLYEDYEYEYYVGLDGNQNIDDQNVQIVTCIEYVDENGEVYNTEYVNEPHMEPKQPVEYIQEPEHVEPQNIIPEPVQPIPKVPNKRKPKSDRPKQPLNAYNLFYQDTLPKEKLKYPSYTSQELCAHMASVWKSLKPEEKKPFMEASMVLREEFYKLYPELKPQVNGLRKRTANKPAPLERTQSSSSTASSSSSSSSTSSESSSVPNNYILPNSHQTSEYDAGFIHENQNQRGIKRKIDDQQNMTTWPTQPNNASFVPEPVQMHSSSTSPQYFATNSQEFMAQIPTQKAVKKPKAPRPKKPENYVKKPPSAFLLFQNKQRAIMSQEMMQLPFGQFVSHCSKAWKQMSNEEKEPYTSEAKSLLDEYKRKYPHIPAPKPPKVLKGKYKTVAAQVIENYELQCQQEAHAVGNLPNTYYDTYHQHTNKENYPQQPSLSKNGPIDLDGISPTLFLNDSYPWGDAFQSLGLDPLEF